MMIITNHSRFNTDQFIEFIRLTSWALVCLSISGIMALSFWPNASGKIPMDATELVKSEIRPDYNSIGVGPLLLSGSYTSPLAAALSHEIALLVPDSRPDHEAASILFGFRNSDQQLNVGVGEKIYLECELSKDANPEQFKISSKPTQIWLKPAILNQSSVLIEAEMALNESVEKCELVLKTNNERIQASAQNLPFYTALKNAKWWGPDVLFQLYGGKEYGTLKEKQKIECGPSICYVSQGNYLTYENGVWKSCDLSSAAQNAPLALVKEISSNQMKLTLWNQEGYALEEIKLHLESKQKNASNGDLFSSIHFRTASQVTCLIGKRRVILKCGDWLLKTGQGWKNLKLLNEIEAYLAHKLKGELFIFDLIEKKEDKFFVKGHLINEMRSCATSLSLPVMNEKKTKSMKKKKKSI